MNKLAYPKELLFAKYTGTINVFKDRPEMLAKQQTRMV